MEEILASIRRIIEDSDPGRKLPEESAELKQDLALTTVDQLNAWDILRNRTLLMTKAGLEQLLA